MYLYYGEQIKAVQHSEARLLSNNLLIRHF
jgi:hypothetical protein